jgi:hypothetical protein
MAKEELRELKGTALVSSLASLLEYFQPKLARTESKNENKNETTVKIDEQTLDTIKSAIQNL